MTIRCEKSTHLESFVLDAFFHIFVLSLVLGLFFFFVVSELERENLNKEIKNSISEGIDKITVTRQPAISTGLKRLSNLYNGETEGDKNYNQGLINQCILVLVLLAFSLVCIWLTMKWSAHKCPNMSRIILQNILLFGSIGIIEYLFFINIASKFIPVMPSYMADVISNKLK